MVEEWEVLAGVVLDMVVEEDGDVVRVDALIDEVLIEDEVGVEVEVGVIEE